MSERLAATEVPAWLWPWCLFLFLLPFEGILVGLGLGLALNLLALCAALLLAIASRSAGGASAGRSVAIVLLMFAFCASSLASLSPAETERALLQAGLHGLIYLLATATPLALPQIQAALRAWAWGGGAAATLALYASSRGYLSTEGGRGTLTVGPSQTDPNFFAAELIVPFTLALMRLTDPRTRLEGGAILGLCAAAVLVTQSRGGAIALITCVLLTLIWERRWKTLGALLVLAGAILGASLSALGRFNLAHDPSGSGRTDLWRVGLEAAFAHWPTGIGMGAFHTLAASASGLYWYQEIHNTYLEAFVEAGLPGLVALLLVLLTHLRFPRPHPLVQPVRIALIAILLDGIFLHFLGVKLFWIALALAAQVAMLGAPGGAGPALSRRTLPAAPTQLST